MINKMNEKTKLSLHLTSSRRFASEIRKLIKQLEIDFKNLKIEKNNYNYYLNLSISNYFRIVNCILLT